MKTKHPVDQGTSFGTWSDQTSRLIYHDATPTMLSGIDVSGSVVDLGGANGLIKSHVPNAITVDNDPTKHPDVLADITTYKADHDLGILRFVVHYMDDRKATALFRHLLYLPSLLVIQFANEDLEAKQRNSTNEVKHFRTRQQLGALFSGWVIKREISISYVVDPDFYRNRLNHPDPTAHNETIHSIYMVPGATVTS